MEQPFYINVGDQQPSFTFQVVDADGNAIDITGAKVYFQMLNAKTLTSVVSAQATVTSAGLGVVRYDWQTTDTSTPGVYKARFDVWSLDGGAFSLPRIPEEDAYIIIRPR